MIRSACLKVSCAPFCSGAINHSFFFFFYLPWAYISVLRPLGCACPLQTAELHGAERLFHSWEPDHDLRPLYTQVAQWRTLLCHFGCFLSMVDYMFETELSNLLKAAVFTLHSAFWGSFHNTRADVKLDTGTTWGATWRPSFSFSIRCLS